MDDQPTVQVPLRRHGVVVAHATVNTADLPLIEGFNWHQHSGESYAMAFTPGKKGHCVLMHRLILGLKYKVDSQLWVDHINRNRLDNRRQNLRVVTSSESNQNKGPAAGSTSKYRGVTWSKFRRCWRAAVDRKGAGWVAWFQDEDEAGAAAAAARARILPFSEEAHIASRTGPPAIVPEGAPYLDEVTVPGGPVRGA